MLAAARSNREIADELVITEGTVEVHVKTHPEQARSAVARTGCGVGLGRTTLSQFATAGICQKKHVIPNLDEPVTLGTMVAQRSISSQPAATVRDRQEPAAHLAQEGGAFLRGSTWPAGCR
jgi:hypothetical protein